MLTHSTPDRPDNPEAPDPRLDGQEPPTGMDHAVAAAGSQAALARLIGVTQQSISVWVVQGYAPTGRALQIADATGVSAITLVDPSLRAALRAR